MIVTQLLMKFALDEEGPERRSVARKCKPRTGAPARLSF
jgi:hypothetical protein